MDATNNNRHGYLIFVKTKYGNGDLVEELVWRDLRWHTRTKFDWYFKYRAALLQVKYPKYYVESRWWTETHKYVPEEVTLTKTLKRRNNKLLQYKQSLELFKRSWNELWSYEENIDYIKAVDKIMRLEREIDKLCNDLETLKNK